MARQIARAFRWGGVIRLQDAASTRALTAFSARLRLAARFAWLPLPLESEFQKTASLSTTAPCFARGVGALSGAESFVGALV
jgi:hypothetical protein